MSQAKTCTKCGETKPLADFYAMTGMRDGHRNDCIVCNKLAKRARYRRNPERAIERVRQWAIDHPEHVAAYRAEYRNRPERKRAMRDLYYRRTYGISADEADAILDSQNGRCAICCAPAPERLASMHLDHDHETGTIRGFLCLSCNQGIGKLRDDPAILLRAIVYLRQRRESVALTGS